MTNVKNLVTNVKTHEIAQKLELLREITLCVHGLWPI